MTSDRRASLSEVNLRSAIKFNSTVNDIFFLTCTWTLRSSFWEKQNFHSTNDVLWCAFWVQFYSNCWVSARAFEVSWPKTPKLLKHINFHILKFTWQPVRQSDMVWCYSGFIRGDLNAETRGPFIRSSTRKECRNVGSMNCNFFDYIHYLTLLFPTSLQIENSAKTESRMVNIFN